MTAPRGTEAGAGTGSTGSPDARWGSSPAPTPDVTADGWTTPEAATAEPDALPDPPADAGDLERAARQLAERGAAAPPAAEAPSAPAGPAAEDATAAAPDGAAAGLAPSEQDESPAASTGGGAGAALAGVVSAMASALSPSSGSAAPPDDDDRRTGTSGSPGSSGQSPVDSGSPAARPAGPRDPRDLPPAVPRAGRAVSPADASGSRPGWAPASADAADPTTVLPGSRGSAGAEVRRPAPARPAGPRPGSPRAETRPAAARPGAARTRRARLALRRLDPWSVFVFSLVASLFVGVALVVAVAVLYAVLGSLGVTQSLNQLFAEVTGGSASGDPLLTGGRIVGGAAVLAALNVVFLTLLATLGSLLYNLCASFTGGIELTLGERD